MVYDNPLFSKDSLKEATSHIGNAVFTLLYDGNDSYSQINAGEELRQAEWILATIIDHVFDYYPYSYFMNDDDRRDYPDFLEWFLEHPKVAVSNAIEYVDNNFAELETVTRDEWNQHRIPQRKFDKEEHVKKVLIEVQDNLDEIIRLLNGPKKITDPGKPSADEIKMLINTIKRIQDNYSNMADEKQNADFTIKVFQTNKFLEMYKLPLLKAWEVYKYGSHTDFWKEGDSMFDYMMFEVKATDVLNDLIESLKQQSPFASIERNSSITNGLLKVYRHLLTQNLR